MMSEITAGEGIAPQTTRAKPVLRPQVTPAQLQFRSRRRALLSVLGGLAIWEFVGQFLVTNPILFSPLSKVLAVGWNLLINGSLMHHIGVSAMEFALGFVLASIAGILLGFWMATSRRAQDILDPWVSFFYSSPLVALMPFFLLIFGIGLASKVAIVFTIAIFPILLNAFVGIRSADPHLLEVASAFNCSRRQVFTKILLPAALPYVIVGLRLGIGRALTGVVVGELFASRAGVGYLITSAGQSFDTATVFFGVLVFSIMGVVLMEGLKRLEHSLAPWRKSVQEVHRCPCRSFRSTRSPNISSAATASPARCSIPSASMWRTMNSSASSARAVAARRPSSAPSAA
jgi:NitT/TauT family transport system permease protein